MITLVSWVLGELSSFIFGQKGFRFNIEKSP